MLAPPPLRSPKTAVFAPLINYFNCAPLRLRSAPQKQRCSLRSAPLTEKKKKYYRSAKIIFFFFLLLICSAPPPLCSAKNSGVRSAHELILIVLRSASAPLRKNSGVRSAPLRSQRKKKNIIAPLK